MHVCLQHSERGTTHNVWQTDRQTDNHEFLHSSYISSYHAYIYINGWINIHLFHENYQATIHTQRIAEPQFHQKLLIHEQKCNVLHNIKLMEQHTYIGNEKKQRNKLNIHCTFMRTTHNNSTCLINTLCSSTCIWKFYQFSRLIESLRFCWSTWRSTPANGLTCNNITLHTCKQ